MAEIEIAGHVCMFPSIPAQTLHTYGATPRTTEVAYVTPSAPLNLTLIAIMDGMHAIGAIERPPYYIDGGQRTIVLLEHPNKQVLETLERWLAWAVGTRWKIVTPYRIARNNDIAEHAEMWDSLQLVKTKDGRRPLMGVHPPHRTMPPIPDHYPDDAGNPLTIPEWELQNNPRYRT